MIPVFVQELEQVVLPAGDKLAELRRFAGKPVTLAPATDLIAEHPELIGVLTRPEVLARVGDVRSLIPHRCVFDDGCIGDLVPGKAHDGTPVWLCWHHDNAVRNGEIQLVPDQRQVLARSVAKHIAGWGDAAELTLPLLCWWAVVQKVIDVIPQDIQEDAARRRRESESRYTGVGWRETNARFEQRAKVVEGDPLEKLRAELKVKQAIRKIDPEPPAVFMKRPKLTRFECEPYLQFVRLLPCVVTGQPQAEAHHLIGHGQSGMGTKASDLFTFPLCHEVHMELHRDPKAWEAKHGSQVTHVMDTLAKAQGLGVFG